MPIHTRAGDTLSLICHARRHPALTEVNAELMQAAFVS
jgi:hypothetical protein